MINKKILLSAVVLSSLPMFVFGAMAFPSAPFGSTFDITKAINNIIGFIWPIFGAFAVIMFIYAGFLFLNAKGDISRVKDARNALLWGMVGVAVAMLAGFLPFIVFALLGVVV